MPNKTGSYRWKIVALLFFATTINYVDRQVLGVLAPQLTKEFNWSESDYGFIVASFQVAYAIGLLISGRLLDRIGTRLGYSITIIVWSIAGIMHAYARGFLSFAGMRFLLGLGESANFPAAVKTVAEWFPKKERALATGLFNSGSNIGAIITPVAVPWMAINWGWQAAFIVTGALGLIWVILWWRTYQKPEKHKKLTSQELEHILQDGVENEQQLPWSSVIFHKQTLGISISLFLTAPIWWFFLYWLPKFLHTSHNVQLASIALPLIVIYVVSDAGAIVGGWFSSALVKKGVAPLKARKNVIFILALMVVPVVFVPLISELWLIVALISLATFAHQGYASNIFTIIPDVFPKKAVGAVTGVAMFFGAVGGVVFSPLVGQILERTGSYSIVFIIAACSYLLSWVFLRLFVRDGLRADEADTGHG